MEYYCRIRLILFLYAFLGAIQGRAVKIRSKLNWSSSMSVVKFPVVTNTVEAYI